VFRDSVKLTAFLPPNAAAEVIPIDLEERRFLLFTVFNHQKTSWVKLAPDRQIPGIRNLSRDGIEPFPPFLKKWNRLKKAFGIRISHPGKNLFSRSVFHHSPRVHYRYPICDF
jgi:hypothetical protein